MDVSDKEPTRSRRNRPGWLSTLLGGGLLILLGFAAGLVVGASVEDPDLIAAALAGNATDVALPNEPLVPVTETAVGPALGARPALAEAAPQAQAPRRRAAAELPAVAAPPPGGFSVQVGAFGDKGPASQLVRQLEGSGFRAFLVAGDGSGPAWRVRVGPVASRPEADALARRLKRDEGLPTWVVSDDG
jgi:cell division septation protein DedD